MCIFRKTVKRYSAIFAGAKYNYKLIKRYNIRGFFKTVKAYVISVEMLSGDVRSYYVSDRLFLEDGAAYTFFEKVSKNLATPENMPYVIEDELSHVNFEVL